MEALVIKYFKFWNSHDIDGLKTMFLHDVELQDWENSFVGIENVLNENKNIFNNFPKIKAEIIDIGVSKNKVMAQIVVNLDEYETLDIVDVITIDSGQIKSIVAYKC